MTETEKSIAQPAETRVTRANILRRIGRLCFAAGELPALPAPERVNFFESLRLTFETAEQAEAWAARFQLDVRGRVYKPTWQEAEIRSVDAHGNVGELGRVHVSGWTTVDDSALADDSAPEDTDPDNLEKPQAVQP